MSGCTSVQRDCFHLVVQKFDTKGKDIFNSYFKRGNIMKEIKMEPHSTHCSFSNDTEDCSCGLSEREIRFKTFMEERKKHTEQNAGFM